MKETITLEEILTYSPQKVKKELGLGTPKSFVALSTIKEGNELGAKITEWEIATNKSNKVIRGTEMVDMISCIAYLSTKIGKSILKVYVADLLEETSFMQYGLRELGFREVPRILCEGKFTQRDCLDHEFKMRITDDGGQLTEFAYKGKAFGRTSKVEFFNIRGYFDHKVDLVSKRLFGSIQPTNTVEELNNIVLKFIEEYPVKRDCIEHTITQHAMKIFLEASFKKGNKTDNKKSFEVMYPNSKNFYIDKMIGMWRSGGLVKANEMFIGQEITKGGTAIDVNNMYGDTMVNSQLPIGAPEYINEPSLDTLREVIKDKTKLLVVHIAYDEYTNNHPLDNNNWIRPLIDNEYGQFHKVLTYNELKELEELTTTYTVKGDNLVEGYVVLEALVYNTRVGVHEDYFLENYAGKLKATLNKDLGDKEYYKLLNNAVTGMIGYNSMKPVFKSYVKDGIVCKKCIGFNSDRRREYSPALYCAITAASRVKLLKAINLIGVEDFLYCDTDGIVCSKTLSEIKSLGIFINDEELGAWGVDQEWTRAKVYGKKAYMIINDETKEEKRAFSGYNKEDIEVISFDTFGINCDIETQEKINVPGGHIYVNVTRKFKVNEVED